MKRPGGALLIHKIVTGLVQQTRIQQVSSAPPLPSTPGEQASGARGCNMYDYPEITSHFGENTKVGLLDADAI